MTAIVGAGTSRVLACRWRPRPSSRRRCARSRQAIGAWVDRLGADLGRGPGRPDQPSRRHATPSSSRCATRSADVSMPVTCPRAVLDALPTPLVEGAQVVVPRQAGVLPRRGARSRCRCARSGWSAWASCSPGSSGCAGCWPPRACSPPSASGRCRSCPARSGWSPARAPPPSATCSRTPGGAGPACASRCGTSPMQGVHAGREVIEAVGALDRDPDVDVIVVARGGGSVEDLLPFSDEALVRAVAACTHAAGLRDRPRAGLPAARPRRRRPRLDADRRRQAGRARRRRGGPARAADARARPARRCAALRRARGPPARGAAARRPVLADPRGGLDDRLAEVDRAHASAPGARSAPARPRRGRPGPPARAGPGALARWPRCAAATPCSPTPRAQALSSVAALEVGQDLHIRVADGRIGATTTAVDRIDLMPETERGRR